MSLMHHYFILATLKNNATNYFSYYLDIKKIVFIFLKNLGLIEFVHAVSVNSGSTWDMILFNLKCNLKKKTEPKRNAISFKKGGLRDDLQEDVRFTGLAVKRPVP